MKSGWGAQRPARCCLSAQTARIEVHESTLSACVALHEIANGAIRVDVNSVGALVRGQTIAAALHPNVAPILQDETQARNDLMRRGAAVLAKEQHTNADVKEMEMLEWTLNQLESLHKDSGTGAGVARYRVVDDHPSEPWVSVTVDRVDSVNGAPGGKLLNIPNIPAPTRDVELEARALSAVQQFVNEVIAEKRVCPYTASAEWAGVGGAGGGITPGAVRYLTHHVDGDGDACASLVSSTLKAGLEMMNSDTSEVSTVLLMLPNAYKNDFQLFSRHAAYLTAVIEHSELGELIDIVLFHPDYNARAVYKILEGDDGQQSRTFSDKGHLPPPEQLAALVVANTNANKRDDTLTPTALALAHDYARRAPVPIINILRTSHLNALSQSTVADKSMVYVRNAEKLVDIGVEKLQARLDEWIQFVHHHHHHGDSSS